MTRTTTVEPLAGSLGAEIHGIDLSGELDDNAIAFVRQALLEHLVVFFRDQDLTPDDQLRFARCFGEIDRYPMVTGMPGYPDIVEIIKYEHETVNFGGLWHSDTAYLERPPMGSILYAREVPPYGGDTLWANTYQAYETLSDGFKQLLRGLTAVHSSAKADVSKTREDRLADHPPETETPPLYSAHPIVRTHPETGRKALYCSGAHTERIKGMTEAESAPYLKEIYLHCARPDFACRYKWQAGDLVIWNNRTTLHYATNDYDGYRRLLYRTTFSGPPPA